MKNTTLRIEQSNEQIQSRELTRLQYGEKDLGITVNYKMNISQNCNVDANKQTA